jgi:predicted O-methyltransferase YrrM
MKIAVCCSYFPDSLVESLVEDLKPWTGNIHLWALEAVVPAVAPFTRGTGYLGKFEALNRLLPHVSDADLVLFFDDDVQLGGDFLPKYLAMVRELGVAVAQPALTANSYHSHPITVERKGCWARLTNFVESGPATSMSRAFLDRVTPFPDSNPMGWGLEFQWAAMAHAYGFGQAIVDACPVGHTFRPVGERYAMDKAEEDMNRFLAHHHISWSQPQVLREYRRIYQRRQEYLEAFPAPTEATVHGRDSDSAADLPLLWAIASVVEPETIVELGTRQGISTRTLIHAARQWSGRVVSVDPENDKAELTDLPCEFIPMRGEELFCTWSEPTRFLFIDTDPHSYRQTRNWLDSWVKAWLADGGVAVFHDVVAARPEIQVAQAVRDWLREQPPIWRWQEFAGTSGLGLLWRLEHELALII